MNKKQYILVKSGYPDYDNCYKTLVMFGSNRGGDEQKMKYIKKLQHSDKKYKLILEEI